MHHLIDITDLSMQELQEIIDLALDIIADRPAYTERCKNKTLATLFYEPSTRTRLSFEAAMLELGGNVLGFSDASTSSVTKGESLADTIMTINKFADIIAMRHPKDGAPLVASRVTDIPIINGGDGSHCHPTQTLADLLTIKREMRRLDNLVIGMCGDLKFGRTVHSLTKAMMRYDNIRFVMISPDELRMPEHVLEELREAGIPYTEVRDMESVMPELPAACPYVSFTCFKLDLKKEWIYISLDLNSLKHVNDTYGHAAGDEMICAAATCMMASFGEFGRVYRIGGDEFAVIITQKPDELDAMTKHFDSSVAEWRGKIVDSMTISYGCVRSLEEDWEFVHDIAKEADRRMYASKARYYSDSDIDRRK